MKLSEVAVSSDNTDATRRRFVKSKSNEERERSARTSVVASRTVEIMPSSVMSAGVSIAARVRRRRERKGAATVLLGTT